MKFQHALLFLAIVVNAQKLVPIYNDQYDLIGWTHMPVQMEAPEPETNPVECPRDDGLASHILNVFNDSIAKQYYYKRPDSDDTAFMRPLKWCLDCNMTIFYKTDQAIRVPVTNPCQLSSGNYTWLFTKDGDVRFGAVRDELEWGAKHIQLARREYVLAAGELMVTSREIFFNTDSGSFMKEIANLVKPPADGKYYRYTLLPKLIRSVFNYACPQGKFTDVLDPIFTSPLPEWCDYPPANSGVTSFGAGVKSLCYSHRQDHEKWHHHHHRLQYSAFDSLFWNCSVKNMVPMVSATWPPTRICEQRSGPIGTDDRPQLARCFFGDQATNSQLKCGRGRGHGKSNGEGEGESGPRVPHGGSWIGKPKRGHGGWNGKPKKGHGGWNGKPKGNGPWNGKRPWHGHGH